jgi:hypothetical protein
VSFDLHVWHESAPIAADEALDKLDRSDDPSAPIFFDRDESDRSDEGESGVFDAHPSVMAFYTALIARFPDLESVNGDGVNLDSVWSVTPQPSDTLVAMCISFSHCDDVAPIVRQLAADHGLVCYDHQLHVVRPNVPGYQPAFTLSCEDGLIPDPSSAHIERAVRKLSRDNTFMWLERADGWFVQAGYGETVAARNDCYAMEYQEGSIERHYHAETSDISAVQRFVQEFWEGNDTWRRRHSWGKLDL